ncbi:Hypervirulence associated protein TUDOR domain-containing protein [Pleurotus pulmonarius]
MNSIPAGSRVFFWGTNSQVVYGTVVSVSIQSDGTQVLQIKDDSGHTHSLPAGGVTKVT